MHAWYDAFLFNEVMTPEQQQALRQALASDPDLAEAFRQWQQLRVEVRSSLAQDVPDRSLLVLYALDTMGRDDALIPEEQQALDMGGSSLEKALHRHPALLDVVNDIKESVSDFDQAWDAQAVQPCPRPAARADRRPRTGRRRRSAGLRWAWRAATAVAVLAFVALSVLLIQRDRNLVTVQTDSHEVRLIELADGSTIRLMGGSQLSYARASGGERYTKLDGRALFDVVPAEQHFVVETPTARMTVLGTSFGVAANAAVTEVVLATGSVSLAPRDAPGEVVMLEPGQQSRVAAHAAPSTPVAVDVSEALAWTGLFFFEARPMEEIAGQLSKYYGVPIQVASELEDEAVTGRFERDQSIEEILHTLAATLGAELRISSSGTYLIVPRSI